MVEARRVRVAAVGDVASGEGRVVEVEGKTLALFNVDGTYYAIDNSCAHRGGPLGEGELDGCVVTCPWHAWRSRSASASTGACAITSAVRTAATSCGVSRRAGFGAARADGSIRKVFACDDRALAAHAPRPHRRRPRGPPPGRRGVVRVRQGTESGHGGVRRGHGSHRRRAGI